MPASTYPSTQWGEVKRFEIPGFAASDILAGAPVKLVSSGDSTFQMCQTVAEKPVGIARDNAVAGGPVSVFDDGNILRRYPGYVGAGASFTRQSYLGIVGTSTAVHPISNVPATYGVLGPVAAAAGVTVGASGAATWALGVAYESAAIGDQAAYRVEPRLLSGLVTS